MPCRSRTCGTRALLLSPSPAPWALPQIFRLKNLSCRAEAVVRSFAKLVRDWQEGAWAAPTGAWHRHRPWWGAAAEERKVGGGETPGPAPVGYLDEGLPGSSTQGAGAEAPHRHPRGKQKRCLLRSERAATSHHLPCRSGWQQHVTVTIPHDSRFTDDTRGGAGADLLRGRRAGKAGALLLWLLNHSMRFNGKWWVLPLGHNNPTQGAFSNRNDSEYQKLRPDLSSPQALCSTSTPCPMNTESSGLGGQERTTTFTEQSSSKKNLLRK